MKTTFTAFYLTCLSLFLLAASNQVFANGCTMQTIDTYLSKGFTHDQVVSLCASAAPATPSTASSASIQQQIQAEVKRQVQQQVNTSVDKQIQQQIQHAQASNNLAPSGSHDELYFATVIKGTPINLEDDVLSYNTRECAVYGEEDISGIRDKACVNTKISIYFDNLKVIRAQKGIMLIRKHELIVKGKITREYLGVSHLDKYQMVEVDKQLPLSMETFNIPVADGIDPKNVAARLNRFIN